MDDDWFAKIAKNGKPKASWINRTSTLQENRHTG
jgi:hypothetical protein